MKTSPFSGLLAALLWLFSAIQVGTVSIRLFTGNVGITPLIGSQLRAEAGPERYVALALLVAFAVLLIETFRLFARLNVEQNAAQAFIKSGISGRMSIPGETMARRRADLLSESRGNVADAMAGISGVDASGLENMFSFARALTWALPSLGFIGAAFALSQSIGGFSVALKGDQNTLIASLAQQVIPGLAGSFAITIVALAAATVGHLCVSALHARGHAIVDLLDASNIGTLTRLADHADGPGAGPIDLHPVTAALSDILEEIQMLNRHLTGANERESIVEASVKLGEAADELRVAAQAFAESVDQPYVITVDRKRREPGTRS